MVETNPSIDRRIVMEALSVTGAIRLPRVDTLFVSVAELGGDVEARPLNCRSDVLVSHIVIDDDLDGLSLVIGINAAYALNLRKGTLDGLFAAVA